MQDVKLPELGSFTWGQIVLILALVAFVFILIKVIVGPGTGGVDIGQFGCPRSARSASSSG